MRDWTIEKTRKFTIKFREYEKKRSDELNAVMQNSQRYMTVLMVNGNPWANLGFKHKEPMGIIALDQTGGHSDRTLSETRLYIYPNAEDKVLHFLTIGDKNSQKKDIKYCKNKVKDIRKKG